MRGDAVEAELAGDIRQRGLHRDEVRVARMPVQHHVDILEQSLAHHVDLAGAAFLRRGAVETDRAGLVRGEHPVLHGDGGLGRRRAEQVVAARVAGILAGDRRTLRHRGLRDAGQRVEFAEDANDRRPLAEARGEGRRHARDSRRDGEARGPELLLQERRALRFLVTDLGETPDFQGRGLEGGFRRVDAGDDGLLGGLRGQGRGGDSEEERGGSKE